MLTTTQYCKSALIIAIFSILLTPCQAFSEDEAAFDSETCLDCHDSYDEKLANTAHRIGPSGSDQALSVNCVSCHAGGPVHAEDPSLDNISNPSHLNGSQSYKTCTTCHAAHFAADEFGFESHSGLQLNCSNCHTVHQENRTLLKDNDGMFCLDCHRETANKLATNSAHPIQSGSFSCMTCHRMTRSQGDNLAYGLSRLCQDCHPAQGGPFLFEHDATDSWAVEGSGCIECHSPHGSTNDRLLRQPGNQLCGQCHVVPRHSIAHGGIFQDYSCTSCHTQTHGSHDNRLFLDPALPSKSGTGLDCYLSGCHAQN